MLDLYDRRVRVYEEVQQFLGMILREEKTSVDDLLKFRRAVSDADFLFGPEIPKYLDEIYQRGVKLQSWNGQYRDSTQDKPVDYNHENVINGQFAESKWLSEQFVSSKERFKKYLNFIS